MDILGREIYDHIVKAKLDESFQGKIVRYEMKYTYPHLGERDLFVTYIPIEGPLGIDRVVCILQDLTERKRGEDERRRLSARLLGLQDEERRKLARDLHDSTGQNLVILETNLSLLRDSISKSDRKKRRLARMCQRLAEETIREVRTLSYLLHPPMLEETGLPDAIRHFLIGFSTRSGIEPNLEVSPGFGRMNKDVELAHFKVVQESLTNIHKHSQSRVANIRLNRATDQVTVEIHDLGPRKSMEVKTSEGIPFHAGVGIDSMNERVSAIGGKLEISTKKSSTSIRVTLNEQLARRSDQNPSRVS